MIKFTPPSLKNTKKYIRDLAVSTLPTGNTYWFEELPQIPFIIQNQLYLLETSSLGKKHELFLNEKLHKSFIPFKSPYPLLLVLNPGIYEFKIINEIEETVGAFQVSTKEFLWQSWITSLEKPFQDLNIIEGRFKNPFNLILLEITYPPDILNLSNSPWVLRNFSQAATTPGLGASFDWFASGLFKSNTVYADIDYGLTDPQKEYSKLTLQFTHPTLSRRGFFIQQKDPELIKETSWNYAYIEDSDKRTSTGLQIIDYFSNIVVHVNLQGQFNLYNESLQYLETLQYDSTRSTQGSYYYFSTRKTSGIYYLLSATIPGYLKPDNVFIHLTAKENSIVEFIYEPQFTSIDIQVTPPTDWILTGTNLNLDTIEYSDFGNQLINIEEDYLNGYLKWTLELLPRPGFISSGPATVYPKPLEKCLIKMYLTPFHEDVVFIYSCHQYSFPIPNLS